MTGLAVLLLAATGTAYGAWASLRGRRPFWATIPCALLFAAAGVLAILVTWISGDGIVFPGVQLSPSLRAYYFAEQRWSLFVPPTARWLLLAAPLGHLLLALARRDRAAVLLPMPATAIFLWLLLAVPDETVAVVRARGNEQVAFLTIATQEKGARLILAKGDPFSTFLGVVHVHDSEVAPPELHLHWTNDGKGLVIRRHEEQMPSFAVDLEGNVTGGLPTAAREWVAPGVYVPGDVDAAFRLFRKEVSKFIEAHGGLAPP